MKSVISTAAAPAAIGPYSQAIRIGDLIFVSGQVALDPATGKLIEDLSVSAQAERAIQNLQGIVNSAGASLDEVVKVTIYLTDMADFQEVNAVYARYFADAAPARATVGVAALPLGVSVEMDCIAVAPAR